MKSADRYMRMMPVIVMRATRMLQETRDNATNVVDQGADGTVWEVSANDAVWAVLTELTELRELVEGLSKKQRDLLLHTIQQTARLN